MLSCRSAAGLRAVAQVKLRAKAEVTIAPVVLRTMILRLLVSLKSVAAQMPGPAGSARASPSPVTL